MFAVLIVLALSAGSVGAMNSAAAPTWVSPTLESPDFRYGMGNYFND